MKRRSVMRRCMAGMLAVCLLLAVGASGSVSECKATSTDQVYSAVKAAYKSSFILSDNNLIKTSRKNIFGNYSTVLGVSAKHFSSYTAAQKSNSKEEYMCFICKAVSKKAVKKIKASIKKYVKNEYKSNISYHSELGKKLLKKAMVGSKGMYVYLFVLDTAGNKKAIKAFKESLK